MIQSHKDQVIINYNKLHADQKQGKTLDIILKKVKHKFVENMSSTTADAFGLSRAILCNDGLIKKLDDLERTSSLYKGFELVFFLTLFVLIVQSEIFSNTKVSWNIPRICSNLYLNSQPHIKRSATYLLRSVPENSSSMRQMHFLNLATLIANWTNLRTHC